MQLCTEDLAYLWIVTAAAAADDMIVVVLRISQEKLKILF